MFGRKQDKPVPSDPTTPQDAPGGYIPIDDVEGVDPDAGGAAAESGDQATDQLLATLRNELDDMSDRLRRTMADFQNYQRRALQNEQEARRQGVSAVVMSVVPVLDHFDLALNQKAEGGGGAAVGILEGVKVIRSELIRALERQGVKVISPAANDVFDPTRHEAIMQQPADGVEPGHISATFQPGFELGDRVIRSAKVAVSPT